MASLRTRGHARIWQSNQLTPINANGPAKLWNQPGRWCSFFLTGCSISNHTQNPVNLKKIADAAFADGMKNAAKSSNSIYRTAVPLIGTGRLAFGRLRISATTMTTCWATVFQFAPTVAISALFTRKARYMVEL